MKPLLLGESPNFNKESTEPLRGLAPALLSLSGVTWGKLEDPYAVLLRHFDAENAWEQPGWSNPGARAHAWERILHHGSRVVVCLGHKAAMVLGLKRGEWHIWEHAFVPGPPIEGSRKLHRVLVTMVPHPSGRCRLYNDAEEKRRACITLRQALEAEGRIGAEGMLPAFDHFAQRPDDKETGRRCNWSLAREREAAEPPLPDYAPSRS